MTWNTNTITELLIAAGMAVAIIVMEFVAAFVGGFRETRVLSDVLQEAYRRVVCVDVLFLAFCIGLATICYRNPMLVPDWFGGGLSAAVASALLGSVLVFVAERIASYSQEKDRLYGFRSARILIDECRSLRLLRSRSFRLVLLTVILAPVLGPFIGNIADAVFAGTETAAWFDTMVERVEKACAACFAPVFVEMIVALNATMILSWRRIYGYEEDWGPYLTRERMQRMYRITMRRWFGLLNGSDKPRDVVSQQLDADLDAAEREGRDKSQLAMLLCSYNPYRDVGWRKRVLASPNGTYTRCRFAEHLRAKRKVLVRHGVADKTIQIIADEDSWFLRTVAGADAPGYYSDWCQSLKDEGLLS